MEQRRRPENARREAEQEALLDMAEEEEWGHEEESEIESLCSNDLGDDDGDWDFWGS